MSGRSQGSPVGDSDWYENDQSRERLRALRDSAARLEQLVLVRVALVQDPRRQASAR